jgi:hypothetical protein
LHPLDAVVGPFYDSASVSSWLGAVPHDALACRTADGDTVYPAWQFTPEGMLLPHLAAVLSELRTGTDDPWTHAIWLRSPSDDLDGMSAAEWLAAGHDPAPVLAAAHDDASRWAA